MRLTGTLAKVPTEDHYGAIVSTFLLSFKDQLIVRHSDIKYRNPKEGDRVSYEIIFNMLGPEDSKVYT